MPLLLPLLLVGCSTDVSIGNTDPEDWSAQERLGLTDAEVKQIVDFLNDCATTLEVLDDDVPLDSDTAENLIDHRDGRDGDCGTGDDDAFDDLDEVDAVPQVGDASILSVLAFVEGGGSSEGGSWEGVEFSEEEVRVVLEIANEASQTELDDDVGLDSDTAANIVDFRPHDTMDDLAETPDVGASALGKLKAYVSQWQ